MSKLKYLAIIAVAVMFISVFSVIGKNVGGNMPDPDGEKHPVYQTDDPPTIDGIVEVGLSWPSESFIGHTYIAGGNTVGDIPTTDVYMMFDNLADYVNPGTGYDPEDEQGFYLYIGIKALDGYEIALGGAEGNWLIIDWDQDDVIDFADNNGNSANPGPNDGYSTVFAATSEGVEWAIPYLDDFSDGICNSPLSIMVHIEIVLPGGGGTDTTTFPGRDGSGPFMSTEICPWELIDPEEPEPGEWGIRTIGFWKHQLNIALGNHKGYQHVPTNDLIAYLDEISQGSTILDLQDMEDDMNEAIALLELRGKHSMYDRAVQQLLATWLNYVSGNEYWDSDGDTIPDESILSIIQWAEASLLDSDPDNDEYVKDYLDELNNSGE